MRPWKGKGYIDIPVENGSVVVIPFDTNLAWTRQTHFPYSEGFQIVPQIGPSNVSRFER